MDWPSVLPLGQNIDGRTGPSRSGCGVRSSSSKVPSPFSVAISEKSNLISTASGLLRLSPSMLELFCRAPFDSVAPELCGTAFGFGLMRRGVVVMLVFNFKTGVVWVFGGGGVPIFMKPIRFASWSFSWEGSWPLGKGGSSNGPRRSGPPYARLYILSTSANAVVFTPIQSKLR